MTEQNDESGYVAPNVESHDVEPVPVEYTEPDMTSHDVEAPASPPYVPPYIHEEAGETKADKPAPTKATAAKGKAKK